MQNQWNNTSASTRLSAIETKEFPPERTTFTWTPPRVDYSMELKTLGDDENQSYKHHSYTLREFRVNQSDRKRKFLSPAGGEEEMSHHPFPSSIVTLHNKARLLMMEHVIADQIYGGIARFSIELIKVSSYFLIFWCNFWRFYCLFCARIRSFGGIMVIRRTLQNKRCTQDNRPELKLCIQLNLSLKFAL